LSLGIGTNVLKLSQNTDFQVLVGNNGCQATQTFSVKVNNPQVEILDENNQAVSSLVVKLSETQVLNLSTNSAAIKWYLDGQLESGRNNSLTESYALSNDAVIVAEASIQNCKATDTLAVKVVKDFKIPVVVTPNGNATNELFIIENVGLLDLQKITIYNRWGGKVFEGDEDFEYWDGTYKGNPSPNGTYYYVIDLKNGGESISGYFTLMR
jgi:gliding motility-associated-like protein